MKRRKCNECGRSYEAQRPTSKFCSSNCRATNHRTAPLRFVPVQPRSITQDLDLVDNVHKVDLPPIDGSNPLIKAIMNELEAAGVLDTISGQQALRIATQMSGYDTASGMASLSKELSRVMAEALRVAVSLVADPMDELAARRDAKLGAG